MVEKWDPVLGPPGLPGCLGPMGPPVPQDLMDPQDLRTLEPQDLRTLRKLPLPFEIQNLNTQKL